MNINEFGTFQLSSSICKRKDENTQNYKYSFWYMWMQSWSLTVGSQNVSVLSGTCGFHGEKATG
jgi:hypothetical protein